MAKKSYFTITKSKSGLYALTWPGDSEGVADEPFSHKSYEDAKEVGLRLAKGHFIKETSTDDGIRVHYEVEDKQAEKVRHEETEAAEDEYEEVE